MQFHYSILYPSICRSHILQNFDDGPHDLKSKWCHPPPHPNFFLYLVAWSRVHDLNMSLISILLHILFVLSPEYFIGIYLVFDVSYFKIFHYTISLCWFYGLVQSNPNILIISLNSHILTTLGEVPLNVYGDDRITL